MYLLDLGTIERNIAKQAIRSGNKIPDRIKNAPKLKLGLDLYLNAFFELDSERNHGMGLASIPWHCIKKYAESYLFDEEQTEDLLILLRRMDAAHLARLDKKGT